MLFVFVFSLLFSCSVLSVGPPAMLSRNGHLLHHFMHSNEKNILEKSPSSFRYCLRNLYLSGGYDRSSESNRSVELSKVQDDNQQDPAARAVKKLEIIRRSRDLQVEDFNDAICECWRGGRWDLSLDLYNSLLMEGYKPNRVTYNAVLGACARGSKHDMAEKIFANMSRQNIEADEISYNAMIISLAR